MMEYEEFFDPDFSNKSVFFERLDYFANEVLTAPKSRSGRRDFGESFRYSDAANYTIPYEGSTFVEAAQMSIEALDGSLRWNDPNAVFNITPSPAIDAAVINAISGILNQNALFDYTSGKVILTEKKVISGLSRLAGWDPTLSGGYSTFGGKGTLIYALKMGINRISRQAIAYGAPKNIKVVCSEACHFSIESVCNFLGLGHDACIRVPCDDHGQMNMKEMYYVLESVTKSGGCIAGIIASGGGTINLVPDDVREIREQVEKLVVEYKLSYKPLVHLDAVISWAWLTLKNKESKCLLDALPPGDREKTLRMVAQISTIEHADSFGVDFHKTGMCPYTSSFLLVKNQAEIESIDRVNSGPTPQLYGEACNFDCTLENSRSTAGILCAYHILNRFGERGIGSYIVDRLRTKNMYLSAIKNKFSEKLRVINDCSAGFELVVQIKSTNDEGAISWGDGQWYQDFSDFAWNSEVCKEIDTPIFGVVPSFRYNPSKSKRAGILIYPVSVFTDEESAQRVISLICAAAEMFAAEKASQSFSRTTNPRRDPPK